MLQCGMLATASDSDIKSIGSLFIVKTDQCS